MHRPAVPRGVALFPAPPVSVRADKANLQLRRILLFPDPRLLTHLPLIKYLTRRAKLFPNLRVERPRDTPADRQPEREKS
jgi:hypothetical protein